MLYHRKRGDSNGDWGRAPMPTEEEIERARLRAFTWGDDERGNILVACCGIPRPQPGPKLTVSASERPFVTVGEYIAAGFPWVDALKDEIPYVHTTIYGSPIAVNVPIYARINIPNNIRLAIGEQEAESNRKEVAGFLENVAA